MEALQNRRMIIRAVVGEVQEDRLMQAWQVGGI